MLYGNEITYEDVIKAGNPIWDHLVSIRIRYKDAHSLEYLRHFGLPTVGDPFKDKQIHNEWVTAMQPIDDLVEHYRAGRAFYFTSNTDVDIVYDIVNKYLRTWNEYLIGAINVGDVPIDDLVLLDRFASVLYDQARLHNGPRKQQTAQEALKRRSSLFHQLKNAGQAQTPAGQPMVIDRHPSLEKAFISRRYGNTPETKDNGVTTEVYSRWK